MPEVLRTALWVATGATGALMALALGTLALHWLKRHRNWRLWRRR